MFIYILNLLNDGLNKKNYIYERSNCEIMNDTWYISELAGIKKNFDIINIEDKIIEVFEVLNKYNVNNQDSIGIITKLIKNNNYLWILEHFYNGDNTIKEELELVLSSIINSTFQERLKDKSKNKKRGLVEIKNVG